MGHWHNVVPASGANEMIGLVTVYDRADFNTDGFVDALDVDLLAANHGTTAALFDLNEDATVTFALNANSDSDVLIRDILSTQYGDANLDRKVNSSDAAIMGGNFGTLSGASLSMGDFNGDGKVNSSDAAILGGNFGFDNSPPDSVLSDPKGRMDANLPEPQASLLTVCLTGAFFLSQQRRSRLLREKPNPTSPHTVSAHD